MAKENAAEPLEPVQPQDGSPQNADTIIPPNGLEINNDLQILRLGKGVPAQDMVELVRKLYPKYDKTLHSKCEHGSEYGIELRADAKTALLGKYAPELLKRHRNERRTKPKRISVRVTETVYALLQLELQQSGQTMQEFIEAMLIKQLTGGENGKH